MKMIDVFNMMIEDKIENDTKLIVSTDLDDYEYRYSKGYHTFFDKYFNGLDDHFCLDKDFLNFEVELIPPKEKKYLIKLTIKGIADTYLNRSCETGILFLSDSFEGRYSRTKFTKDELKSIQPVREFLEDMEGKYELIEAEE